MVDKRFWLTSGRGGWAHLKIQGWTGRLYVRATPDASGRVRVRELHLYADDDSAIEGLHLRELGVHRIEGLLNEPGIRASLVEADDEREAAWTTISGLLAGEGVPRRRRVPRPLIVPDRGADKGERFYQAVADHYRWHASEGRSPAKAIADELAGDEDEVPVTTVHRWVREARRRGLLAPARGRGVVG